MGCGSSKAPILHQTEGDGNDFFDKYELDRILGEGEFGVVRLVFDKKRNQPQRSLPPLACKILRKGSQFKNNTLYSAIKPRVLRLECEILRTLQGKHYNLCLRAIYESPSSIYIVTDFYAGGDMFHYVSDNYKDSGLRVEDISRMSFQLFDAVHHCAKHGVIHRDIKPENIMFQSSEKGSPLCLIDFGSGTMSLDEEVQVESTPKPCKQSNGDMLSLFTTFAGSAFYISPEMFQRSYTSKTDVWSVGVTLYVLTAGYPFKDLQVAFDMLQTSKKSSIERMEQIKCLPNMPDMPYAFYEMLEKALTFRHTKRSDAGSLLNCDFIRSHTKEHEGRMTEPTFSDSSVIDGVAIRHHDMRHYAQYELAVSALIASVLSRHELKLLLEQIDLLIKKSPEDHIMMEQEGQSSENNSSDGQKTFKQMEQIVNRKRLQILRMKELQTILEELKFQQVIQLLKERAGDNDYGEYAYHVAKLKQFYTYEDYDRGDATFHGASRSQSKGSMDNSMTRKLDRFMKLRNNENATTAASAAGKNQEESAQDVNHKSVHGNNVWESIKKQMKANNPNQQSSIQRTASVPDLTHSSHF